MAESNKPSNPRNIRKAAAKLPNLSADRADKSPDDRREETMPKHKTVLSRPAPAETAPPDARPKIAASAPPIPAPLPKKAAFLPPGKAPRPNSDGDGEHDEEITAERRKPTRVDNDIPAALRDADPRAPIAAPNAKPIPAPKPAAPATVASNRPAPTASGENTAQTRQTPQPSAINPAQTRQTPQPSGINPAQTRQAPQPSGANPAQTRQAPQPSGANPAQTRQTPQPSGINPAQPRQTPPRGDASNSPAADAQKAAALQPKLSPAIAARIPKTPSNPPISQASAPTAASPSKSDIPALKRMPPKPASKPPVSDAPRPAAARHADSAPPFGGAVVEVPSGDRQIASGDHAGEEENTRRRKNPTLSSDTDARAVSDSQTQPADSDGGGMPSHWTSSKKSRAGRDTFFSAPQTIPRADAQQTETTRRSDNVHLERNESLPEALEDIIAAYDDEIVHSQTRDGARECTIQLCIARILEHTGYEKLAYVRYLKALEANHVSQTAIHELRRIARAYNKPKDVVTLLQSALDSASAPEEQATLLEECGLIVYFSENDQREDGIAMLCRAAALAPNRISAHLTLLQLFMFEERFADCCDILEKLVSLTDDHQAKVLCHTMLGDIQSSLNPGKDAGLNAYLRVLSLEPDSLYAFQHAMGVVLRQKSYHAFYGHCLAFAQATKDKAFAHAILVLAGTVAFDILSDSDSGIAALRQAAKFRPNDRLPLDILLEYYSLDPAKWRECDAVMDELIKYAQTPKERRDLMLMRALNADINGKAPILACDYLRAVCNEGTTDPIVLDYYGFLLELTDAIPEAMAVRKMAIEQSNGDESALRFAHLGCFCLNVLKKTNDAETCFRNALAINPDNRIAFENLDAILRARNDWSGLLQIYLARLDVVLDARMRASILHTLATICYCNLGNCDNAVLYYNQYLEIFPDDIHALHCLEQIYIRTKNWNKLIDVYVAEKDTLSSPAARRDLLMRMASVCFYELNNPNYAFKFLMQAKEETPNCAAVYHDILRIANHMQDWRTYVIISEELLGIAKKNEEKIVVLFNAAVIFEHKLCDARSAVRCYEQILDISPDNAVAYTRLAAIYNATGNKTAYYDLALRRAQSLPPSAERSRILFKVGLKAYTQFDDIAQATSLLETAAATDISYLPAVTLLSLLYVVDAKIEQLISLLQDFTNSAREQKMKSTCAMTIAYLRTWILKSPQDAIHPLELALALTPEATHVGYMLIMANYKRGLYAELPPLFTERAQNTSDRDYAVFYYNMAAFIAHRFPARPDVPDCEIAALKAALALDPDNIIANERLEAMEPCRANLVPFLEKRLKYAHPDDKTEILLAIAETICNEQPQKAFSLVSKIVDENPSHLPAARIATNMAAKLNNDNLCCKFMALQAQNLDNIAMRIIAWSNAGKIAEEKLRQTDTAINCYKQAFMLAPQQMELCDQLLNLLRKKHDFAAIDGIMQIHTRSLSRENQAARYAEMADIYLNEFNNTTQAAIKLRQILEIEHDNCEALQKLANIEIKDRHFSQARAVLETLVAAENVPKDMLTNARRQLASLCLHKFNRPDLAQPLLEQVLISSPDDVAAIEDMADVCIAQSKYAEALTLLLRLKTKLRPEKCSAVLLQIASICQILDKPDKLPDIMRELADIVKLAPQTLGDVEKWFAKNHTPSIILPFIEKLIALRDISDDLRVAVYEFAAKAYAGPLHMRFEADKYAVAAAKLAPNSFKTQLLAARVFSPKDAMVYAAAAAKLSPFIPDAYRAMLNIAVNSGRADLQARVEQTLEVLDPEFKTTEQLQTAYMQRYPKLSGSVPSEIIASVAPPDINFNVQKLLSLSEEYAQIFDLPKFDPLPASSCADLTQTASEIAVAMGMPMPDISFCRCDMFVFSKPPHERNALLFNAKAFENASPRERRFHVAAALMHLKLGTLPFVFLPPGNIAMLISGLLGLCDEKLTSPDILSRVKSFIPRNIRRNIAEFVSQQGVRAFMCDPQKMQTAITTLDAFVGHAFCLDLKASVAGIIRRSAPNTQLSPTPARWILSNTGIPQIQSLFEFNIGERYSEFRQKLGIFIRINEES